MQSNATHRSPARTVVQPTAAIALAAALGFLGACSFEPTAGLDADAAPERTPADASAEVRGDDSSCPPEGCRCNFRDNSTGVCSEGRRDGGECRRPEQWVEDEGADGGCGDRIDNDCDGEIDEDCECSPEETESCYTGSDETRGVGVCEAGERTCTPEGTWSRCEGEVTPTEEICGNSRDDDCNGTVDDGEGCSCAYQDSTVGVCADGTYDSAGQCTTPEHYESTEAACDDGRDNDCDGSTDFGDQDCKRPVGAQCGADEECQSDGCAIEQGNDTGNCAHRIFVTSETYSPDFGSSSDADALCQQLAQDENLTGNWKAVISEQNDSARDRLRIDAPIANMNKDLVAVDSGDLWNGRIRSAVRYDETGAAHDTRVWTGTNEDGTWDGTSGEIGGPEDCDGWTSASASDEAEVGRSTSEDNWIENAGTATFNHHECDNRAGLYCIDGQ